MVNSKSNTPGSSGASSTPSAASVGASSTPAGSPAGGGSASVSAPPVGAIPGATTMPPHTFRNEVNAVAGGVGTQFPDGSTIAMRGQSMTKTSILAALQAVQTLFGNVDSAAQSAKSARLALTAALPEAHQFLMDLKAALVAFFGKGNPVLESFGFSGVKPRKLTVEQKTARKAKAAETRALRGTGGKRQKAAVKFTGQIEVQTVKSGTPAAGGNASPTGSSQAGAGSNPTGGDTGSGSTPAAK